LYLKYYATLRDHMEQVPDGVPTLVRDSRRLRQAVHDLIVRVQRDRHEQRRELAAMVGSMRLTAPQRQRLGGLLRRMPPR